MVIEEYQKENVKIKILDDAISKENTEWESKLIAFLKEWIEN